MTFRQQRDLFYNLLVTAGCRAGCMNAAGMIELPSGVDGEDELAKFCVKAVSEWMDSRDESFDLYIEQALAEEFPCRKHEYM